MKTVCNSWYYLNGIKQCSQINTTGCRQGCGDIICGLYVVEQPLPESEPQKAGMPTDELPESFKTLYRCLEDSCYEINFYGNDGNDNQEKIDGKQLLISWITDAFNESRLFSSNVPEVKDCDKCVFKANYESFSAAQKSYEVARKSLEKANKVPEVSQPITDSDMQTYFAEHWDFFTQEPLFKNEVPIMKERTAIDMCKHFLNQK